MAVLSAAIKIGNIIVKYGGKANIGATNRIVQTFPPNLRPYVRDVLKGANTVTVGGVISDILQAEWNEYAEIPKAPKPTSNQFQQERGKRPQYSGRSGYGYNRFRSSSRRSCVRKCYGSRTRKYY